MQYKAKDTKSQSAALLASQLIEGKAAAHMLESGVNQDAVALYAARLAFAYIARDRKEASVAGLADLFKTAGICNASALRQAAEAIVAVADDGRESAALPTTGRAAIAPTIWADL